MPSNMLLAAHLIPALSATATGAWMVARPKGTPSHKRVGKIWVTLMLMTAITSFAITGGPFAVLGGFSYIHLLSVIMLVAVPLGVWAARHQRVALHKFIMISLYVSLWVTGLFALLMKGRILHGVLHGELHGVLL